MGCLIEFHALKMAVFSIVTAAFFQKDGLWPVRETVSGRNARYPVRKDIMRSSVGGIVSLTVSGKSGEGI
jgi:hypothetical protein